MRAFLGSVALLLCLAVSIEASTCVSEPRFVSGDANVCILNSVNNNPLCWGRDFFGESSGAPAVQLSAVTTGAVFSCGIATADGSILCWGYNASGELAAPSGSFAEITAGSRHACAIESSVLRRVFCWGLSSNGRTANQLVAFNAIDAGGATTCGILASGVVTCWGFYTFSPPSTQLFSEISTGFAHACGILANGNVGAVSCWPSGIADGRTTPPSTGVVLPVVVVSAGGSHTCMIDSSQNLFCFGSNIYGETTVPSGKYFSVTCGWYFTCAIRSDYVVICFGDNSHGRATPPSGVQPCASGTTVV